MSAQFIPKEKIVRHCKKIPVHPKKPVNAAILGRASALDRVSTETLSRVRAHFPEITLVRGRRR
ncbi:MAG: hypothetical protein DME76_00510, partial [Verrucomicrobia bacterium]